jgi:hypothetical protein
MKNIRTLLIAISAVAFINVAHAQAPGSTDAAPTITGTAPAATGNPNAPYSADPLVQKRQADGVAKADYKARKKVAKQKMKAEKKAAKAEMKSEKAEATEIRNDAMAPAAK